MTFTEVSAHYRSVGKFKKCTFIFCADHGVAKFAYSEPVDVDAGVDANIYAGAKLVKKLVRRGNE